MKDKGRLRVKDRASEIWTVTHREKERYGQRQRESEMDRDTDRGSV